MGCTQIDLAVFDLAEGDTPVAAALPFGIGGSVVIGDNVFVFDVVVAGDYA
jgi:hypothetical protein